MPKTRRRLTDKKKMDQFYDNLWEAISLLQSKQEVREFFNDFLTQTEKMMLAKRFQVVLMLIEGCYYETIKDVAEVSNSTINRMNNQLKLGAISLFRIVPKLLEEGGEYFKKSTFGKKYMPGDLLTPAIVGGASLIASKMVKRQRKKRVMAK